MLNKMRLSTASGMWLIAVVALAASGCGSVSNSAQFESGFTPKADTRIEVGPVTNDTSQTFDVNIQQMFTDALTERLQTDNLLWTAAPPPDHLIIATKIVEYDPGNAFKRWLLPGYGSTVITLHCELKDSTSGKLVGSVDAHRTVAFGGAYTIGAWKTIFASVAKDVVSDLRSQIPTAVG
jgi:Domain of unknown function (DUF4410)